MHYFSYAYIILIQANKLDNSNGFITALVFVLGWITYTSAQYIFRGKNYFKYLIIGHVFLVVVLLAMSNTNSEFVRIGLWILTGFGGGTVFCIKELYIQHGVYQKYLFETAENYGHVIGVICCIVMLLFFKNINAPVVFASICAAFTATFASIFQNRRRDRAL